MNYSGGFHRFFFWSGFEVLPKGWYTVDFTVDELMSSTLMERLSAGGWIMGSLSVLVHRRWLDLTWWRISGRYYFQPLGERWRTLLFDLDYIHPVIEAEGRQGPSRQLLGRSRYLERLKVVWMDACQFSQALWWGINWGGHLYWVLMRLGFPYQNVGDIDFPSPVVSSDIHVSFRNIWHLFSSEISSPWINFLLKSSIK